MLHLDLFSGIGGFALAVEEAWPDARHIFCDNDKFCQQVLKKHWPQAEIWGDIRELIAHAKRGGHIHGEPEIEPAERRQQALGEPEPDIPAPFILTGGFPCQPFSHAGKRRGKSDDRFLWPEMLECIRLFKPRWVVAENVYGLLSIESGVVFEQVCSDMEKEGYEVWPFIIPACSVNAPHRRDRVWIVGHNEHWKREEVGEVQEENSNCPGSDGNDTDSKGGSDRLNSRRDSHIPDSGEFNSDAANAEKWERNKGHENDSDVEKRRTWSIYCRHDWNHDWVEVASRLCCVDDGLPRGVARLPDGTRISEASWRKEALKAYGNSIVPEVAVEIMKAIRMSENPSKRTTEKEEQ